MLDFFKELKNKEFSLDYFQNIAKNYVPKGIIKEISMFIDQGKTINLGEMTSYLPIEKVKMGSYERGFDRQALIEDKTIKDIDENSNAYKSGLRNGDNIIDQNDQRAIGFPTYPLYNAGINCGFQLKNFDLSMSWAGAANTSRLLAETYRQAFGQTLDRSLLQYMADGRWTPETADRATFPRMTLTGGANNNRNSDFWLRDASYLRLKNLEAGYNFKGNFLKKFGVSNLRTFINGANLITITKLDITDPESRTGDDSEYPLTKIYNFGLRVTFL